MSACIWWTPPGAAAAQKISLGRALNDLQVTVVRDQTIVEAMSGREAVSATRARSRLRVVYGPFTGLSEYRALEALVNHLDRGGLCQLAEDETMAYAAFVDSLDTVDHDSSGTTMHPTPWAHTGATLSAGQAITMTGPSPKYLQEHKAVGTYGTSSRLLTWTPATAYRWSAQEWAMVRHSGFWPALKRAKEDRGQQALQHSHRMHWTLDLHLDEDTDLLGVLAETPDQPLLIDADSGAPAMVDLRDEPRFGVGTVRGS